MNRNQAKQAATVFLIGLAMLGAAAGIVTALEAMFGPLGPKEAPQRPCDKP